MPDCNRRSARRWIDLADPAEAAALAAGYAALLDDFPPTPADGDEAASLDRLVEAVRTVSSIWDNHRRASGSESAAADSTPPRECLSPPPQMDALPPSAVQRVSKIPSPIPFEIDSVKGFIRGCWAVDAADPREVLPNSDVHEDEDDGRSQHSGSETSSGWSSGFGSDCQFEFAVKGELYRWADDSDLGLHFGRPAADLEPPGDSHSALLTL